MNFSQTLVIKKQGIGLFLLINYLCFFPLTAQQLVSSSEYLRSAKNAYQVKTDNQKLSFLSDYNYNLPLIRGAQIRSETNDFLLRKQEYSLRISPNSLSAISNQKKVYQSKIEKLNVQNQRNFNKELIKRYQVLIDYYFTNKLIELFLERQIQIKDKLTILSQSIYDINFNVNDLIDTEEELITIELKLANLKEDKYHQLYLIKQFLDASNESLEIDFNDFIKDEQIIKFSLSNIKTREDLSIRLQKIKLNTLDHEMRLAASKSNQIIDFFQVKYEGANNFVLQEHISAGIGINLPFFAGTRRKKGKYYFEKLTEESKLISLNKDVEDNQILVSNEFKTAITNYQTLQSQFNNSNVASVIGIYENMEGVSPIIVLKLNILQNKKSTEILKARHDFYKNYIKSLHSKGIIYELPLRNYLSSDIKLLTP